MKLLESIKSFFSGASKKKQLEELVSLGIELQSAPSGSIAIEYLNTLKKSETTPESMFMEIDKIYQKSLSLARKINDREMEGDILFNLGRLYQDPPRKTIINLENLSEEEKEAKLTERLQNFTIRNPIPGNQNTALTYFYQALEIAKKEQKLVLEASCLLNIAVANRLLCNFQQHLEYVKKASEILVKIKDKEMKEHIEKALTMEQLFVQKP